MVHSLALILGLVVVSCSVPADEVLSVPGYIGPGTPPFKHYSGYLQIPGTQKQMHYWFIESERDPANDPLLLWLNGGPGCSSLYGAIREMGPLMFDFQNPSDDTVYYNPNGWTQISNVLFVESPVGVGFSYSPNSTDYSNSDTGTARDNYAMLLDFFNKFPEYRPNDFYISGESYAGMYIPTLAEQIRLGNDGAGPFVNLKGLLIGNGVTHPESDNNYNSLYPFYIGRQVASQETAAKLLACNGGSTPNAPLCVQARQELSSAASGLNRYQIFEPCLNTPRLDDPIWEKNWAYEVAYYGEVPCVNSEQMNRWLRDPVTMEAFHVNPTVRWEICSSVLRYTRDLGRDSYQFYPRLLEQYRIWKFYGDSDAAVPATGGEIWTALLAEENDYRLAEQWRRWTTIMDGSTQTAGWIRSWDVPSGPRGFAFITFKAGWHTVPESHPLESLHMWKSFIENTVL